MTTEPTTAPEPAMTEAEARGYIALGEKATGGPWHPVKPILGVVTQGIGDEADRSEERFTLGLGVGIAQGDVVCLVLAEDPERADVEADKLWDDGAFIAASRSAIPRLATAWLAQERQVAEARAEVERLGKALAVYADKDNWGHPFIAKNGEVLADAFVLVGTRRGPDLARETLGLDKPEEASG